MRKGYRSIHCSCIICSNQCVILIYICNSHTLSSVQNEEIFDILKLPNSSGLLVSKEICWEFVISSYGQSRKCVTSTPFLKALSV